MKFRYRKPSSLVTLNRWQEEHWRRRFKFSFCRTAIGWIGWLRVIDERGHITMAHLFQVECKNALKILKYRLAKEALIKLGFRA